MEEGTPVSAVSLVMSWLLVVETQGLLLLYLCETFHDKIHIFGFLPRNILILSE